MITETRHVLVQQRRRLAQLQNTIEQTYSPAFNGVGNVADVENKRERLIRLYHEQYVDHQKMMQIYEEQMAQHYDSATQQLDDRIHKIEGNIQKRNISSATVYSTFVTKKREELQKAHEDYDKKLKEIALKNEKEEIKKALEVTLARQKREARLRNVELSRNDELKKRESKRIETESRRDAAIRRAEDHKQSLAQELEKSRNDQEKAAARKAYLLEQERLEVQMQNEKKREIAMQNSRNMKTRVEFVHLPGQKAQIKVYPVPGDYQSKLEEAEKWNKNEQEHCERALKIKEDKLNNLRENMNTHDKKVLDRKDVIDAEKEQKASELEAERKWRYQQIQQSRRKSEKERREKAEAAQRKQMEVQERARQRQEEAVAKTLQKTQERWVHKSQLFFKALEESMSPDRPGGGGVDPFKKSPTSPLTNNANNLKSPSLGGTLRGN